MTTDQLRTSYRVSAFWGPRGETPDELGVRFGRFMDGLATLDPRLELWRVGMRRPRSYEDIKNDLTALFRRDVARDDFGAIFAEEGYDLVGLTRTPDHELFGLSGSVGASINYAVPNHVYLESYTSPKTEFLKSLTYNLLRSILIEMIQAWQPTACDVRPTDFYKLVERCIFSAAWISYVPPEWAGSLSLPDIPLIETLPGGGLLLAATTERFESDNPDHLAAARRLGAAIRHLNAGRWSPHAMQPPWEQYGPPE